MYDLNAKIGRKPKGDEICTFITTVSSTAGLIPCNVGKRNYIKILNTGSDNAYLLSDENVAEEDGFIISANGGIFEDYVEAPLYMKISDGSGDEDGNVYINIYERRTR